MFGNFVLDLCSGLVVLQRNGSNSYGFEHWYFMLAADSDEAFVHSWIRGLTIFYSSGPGVTLGDATTAVRLFSEAQPYRSGGKLQP